jgi:putrescine transport system permease protein
VTFLTVTLAPVAAGYCGGCMLVFIPAIGEYVIPALLGGPDTLMIGRVLWDEFFSAAIGPWRLRWRWSCWFWSSRPIMWLQTVQNKREER